VAARLALRDARDDDAAALARLVTQLGYPSTEAQLRTRLAAMHDATARRRLFVAESDGRVAGLVVAEVSQAINHDAMTARLATLVVDEELRGQGIGRALVEHFEQWAKAQGATHASLTSANRREDAHAFYRSCGWEPTGVRFGSKLTLD
jgi:GNAT superfamily N-acetyltransferase